MMSSLSAAAIVSSEIVQYRLDNIDEAIKDLYRITAALREAQGDVTKWLIANLAAVVVALIVYILTLRKER